jgi:(1->4)-alpha-D-glucan 1-alpha-D-glucosylmutase
MVRSRTKPEPAYVPASTYRLQLNREFTFTQAAGLMEYLQELGIGACYLSPILKAAPGSPHGYDVTNHASLNPEIGSREEFRQLSERLKEHGMGMIVDVVPNHMSIAHRSNEWWWDLLENGPSSLFAPYFDIEWHPPKSDLKNKVLLPILGDQYGRVLEDQQITVVCCPRGGFWIRVYDRSLPLAPRSWTLVLQPAAGRLKERLGDDDQHVLELESILTALSHLAPADEKDEGRIRERQREKEVIGRRLLALMDSSEAAREVMEVCRQEINGIKGVPRSFDRLEELLAQQSYRLCYWRVASDEINYRRFFDVNELAAIRVERPEVFAAVHALIFELIQEGYIDGLRVDHSDGLLKPAEYFRRLQSACMSAKGATRPFFIVTEKILAGNEELRSDWKIEGTTGYDFLGVLNGVFVDRNRRRALEHLYQAFSGWSPDSEDLVYECKKLILQATLASEVNLLTNKLDRISEQHRWSRDFTRSSLRHVLRETVACFPIYRTYTTEQALKTDAEDERHIRFAISQAKRRNPSTSESIFDFLQSVLLLEDPDGIDAAQRAERRQFVMSLQQFTGPVMAKGLEDTAFYRRAPLASLNEVGADRNRFGATPAVFHALNLKNLASWPNTMLATSTHDSKRSEDVRARINVLSEIPAEWYRALRQWRSLNLSHKADLGGVEVPSAAEEYFFYENLLGVWPMKEPSRPEYEQLVARMQAYMNKALREAKIHTSWISPNRSYEEAVEHFVGAVLDPSRGNDFLREFRGFVSTVIRPGMWNSLSQSALKIASPGVPDFYQGSEIWDLSLVDPDNRRPVDYALRRCLMQKLQSMEEQGVEPLVQHLMQNSADGAVKLYVTSRALRFRQAHHDLFSKGAYHPLRAAGDRQNHVVAFARTLGRRSVIAVAGRFFMGLGEGAGAPLGVEVWGDSVLLLRKEFRDHAYRDVFTHRIVEVESRSGKRVLPLGSVFSHLPVTFLESVER